MSVKGHEKRKVWGGKENHPLTLVSPVHSIQNQNGGAAYKDAFEVTSQLNLAIYTGIK